MLVCYEFHARSESNIARIFYYGKFYNCCKRKFPETCKMFHDIRKVMIGLEVRVIKKGTQD